MRSPLLARAVLCLLVAFCQAAVIAEDGPWEESEATAALYAAAREHRNDFHALMMTRGAPVSRLGDESSRYSLLAIKDYGVAGLVLGPGAVVSAHDDRQHSTAVVFYHHDGEYLQVWAAARGVHAWERRRLSAEEVAGRVAAIHAQLRVPGSSRGVQREDIEENDASPVADPQALAGASAWLFPGDIDLVLRESGVNRVIIVPWGPLGSVPFSVLPRDGNALADTHAISIAPSLDDLYAEPVYRARVPSRPLVIGNPAFARDSGLAPLPGAEREAKAVARLFDIPATRGTHATRAAITGKLPDADLLYFATHGIVDPADPLDGAYLALAGDGPDARWTARQIQHTRLRPGAVVVMSACDTGRGAVQRAGVIGLARAFQLAGAAEVVMSLWPVDDDATAQLMPRFAALLREGRRADEALQQAMREQRARTPDPARWGAFTVFSRPVEFQ